MAVIAEVVLPGIDPDTYDMVRATVGHLESPPAGAQAHLTWWEGADCHNLDAWESEEAFDAFARNHLQPTIAKLGIDVSPRIRLLPAHEVYLPRALTIAPTAEDLPAGDNVALLRDGYAAFGRGDIPAVLELFDPAIAWYAPDTVRFGGIYSGPDAVASFFSKLPENYAELAVEPGRYIDRGDTVVVLGNHRGRGHSGTTFDVPFAHVWTLQGGKVTSFTEYFDTVRMNLAIGIPAQQISVDAPTTARA